MIPRSAGLFYDRLLEEHGCCARGLAFGSTESQRLRFEAFADLVSLEAGDQILDVGCGMADFYHFLEERGFRGSYTGWDVSRRALAEARRRFPEIRRRLLLHDARQSNAPCRKAYDWVFCSGTFNVEFTEDEACRAMGRLFATSRKGFVACFQNHYGTFGPPAADGFRRTKYLPDRLYRKAKESTPFVVVRDDYLPHDFLLALFQKPFHERLGSSPKTVRRESHE